MAALTFMLAASFAVRTQTLLVATVVGGPGEVFASPIPPASARAPQRRPNIDGYYVPRDPMPAGFENVDRIAVFLWARKEDKMPESGIYLTNGWHYRMISPVADAEKFTFNTPPVRRTSYAFEGRFLVRVPAEADPDKPVLEGTLTKYLGTKKVGEAKVVWMYHVGD